MNEKKETRGRKSLVEGEPTTRIGVCLPLSLFDQLCDLGEKTGKGYGFHVREACEKYIKQVNKRRKK